MGSSARTLQNLFRTVNERLHNRMMELAVSGRAPRICECNDPDCLQILELTIEEYAAVRSSPDRYFVARGHAQPELERVVERRDEFDIVEAS